MPFDESAAGAPPSTTTTAETERIDDWNFIQNLKRMKELHGFLIQEAVPDAGAVSFDGLNGLWFHQTGRSPTRQEWAKLEAITPALFGMLSGPLRRKFVAGSIPGWMTSVTMAIGGAAILSLIGAVMSLSVGLFGAKYLGINALPFYIVWLACLGAIGSIAFIGMNALSVQDDITFDMTNNRLMVLRIVLGGLFGLVLTLPFGFRDFVEFCSELFSGAASASPADANPNAKVYEQAIFLLLPFILGFSNSLVIMILNRLVGSVEAFFGKSGAAERAAAEPLPTLRRRPPDPTPPPSPAAD
jgi:hypothetical protein